MAGRPWYRRMFYGWVRGSCGVAAWIVFRFRVIGGDNFPKSGGGLVCANHQSYFDPVLVGVASTRHMNFLARKSLFRSWPFRWLISMLDAIPIDRDGMGIGGLKETLRRLKRGEMVLIFPEGTRTADGKLQRLQSGFVAVARRGKAPLVPIGIDGAFQAWPRDRSLPRPTPIVLCVGQPISSDHVAALSDEELVAELTRRIEACFACAQSLRVGASAETG